MKTALKTLLFLSPLVLFSVTAHATPVATLGNVQGEVLVLAPGATESQWQAATANMSLESGSSLKTTEGTCAVTYGEAGTFSMQPNTAISIQEKENTQDILLAIGKLKGKVNKDRVIKPFQVVTPTAVASVRGTEVDFDFNENGDLTIDLHDDGPVHVHNGDVDLSLDLSSTKKITVSYDKEGGILKVTNDCGSSGPVIFSVQGQEYQVSPCETSEVAPETAEGDQGLPKTPGGGNDGETTPNENPEDEIPAPLSPVE